MDLSTRGTNPGTIRPRTSHDDDEITFKTPSHSISDLNGIGIKEMAQEDNKELKENEKIEHKEEPKDNKNEEEEDEDDGWNEATNSRRSNCGRNIA